MIDDNSESGNAWDAQRPVLNSKTRSRIVGQRFKLSDLSAAEEIRKRRAKMKLNRFQQLAASRAPHVNPNIRSVAHRRDVAPAVEPAHFPELDADRVHGVSFNVAQSIRRRLNSLIGHDRHGYVLSDEGHTANVIAMHGLFDQAEVRVFQLPQDAHRLHRRIGLIGVRRQKDIFADRVPYLLYSFKIPFFIKTDFHLDMTVASIDQGFGFSGGFLRWL